MDPKTLNIIKLIWNGKKKRTEQNGTLRDYVNCNLTTTKKCIGTISAAAKWDYYFLISVYLRLTGS